VRLASCNPLSTDDKCATALAEVHGLDVYARKWQSNRSTTRISTGPESSDLVIDDGPTLCPWNEAVELLKGVRGETKNDDGHHPLRAMERDGALRFRSST